jgi:anti-sigma factor RsiW
VISRTHHLHDDRLFECYVAGQSGDPQDPPAAEHLADCDECSTRYAELVQFMDGIRAEADAETAAVFTPERLRQQQHQILERLEHIGHPARVISFPVHVTRRMVGATRRVGPRWLAAAAAAGLFVGVGVGGMVFDARVSRPYEPMMLGSHAGPSRELTASAVRPSNPDPVLEAVDDDAFLEQLEFALQRPRTRELLPFDALTPHLREVSNSGR